MFSKVDGRDPNLDAILKSGKESYIQSVTRLLSSSDNLIGGSVEFSSQVQSSTMTKVLSCFISLTDLENQTFSILDNRVEYNLSIKAFFDSLASSEGAFKFYINNQDSLAGAVEISPEIGIPERALSTDPYLNTISGVVKNSIQDADGWWLLVGAKNSGSDLMTLEISPNSKVSYSYKSSI